MKLSKSPETVILPDQHRIEYSSLGYWKQYEIGMFLLGFGLICGSAVARFCDGDIVLPLLCCGVLSSLLAAVVLAMTWKRFAFDAQERKASITLRLIPFFETTIGFDDMVKMEWEEEKVLDRGGPSYYYPIFINLKFGKRISLMVYRDSKIADLEVRRISELLGLPTTK